MRCIPQMCSIQKVDMSVVLKAAPLFDAGAEALRFPLPAPSRNALSASSAAAASSSCASTSTSSSSSSSSAVLTRAELRGESFRQFTRLNIVLNDAGAFLSKVGRVLTTPYLYCYTHIHTHTRMYIHTLEYSLRARSYVSQDTDTFHRVSCDCSSCLCALCVLCVLCVCVCVCVWVSLLPVPGLSACPPLSICLSSGVCMHECIYIYICVCVCVCVYV
jgi:hypothetical protein